jgi:hypothetical protein
VKTFVIAFKEVGSHVQLELTNATPSLLRSVEILSVFLKDQASPGGPSQAHIKFSLVESIRPQEHVVIPHKTWINGRPAGERDDQLARLKPAPGQVNPYVLDISWTEPSGKTCFQRIPVGH